MKKGLSLAIAICAVCAALLISEVVYRLLVYKSLLLTPPLTTHHHSFFCEYDPLLGWRHKPNTTGRFVTSEGSAVLNFNHQGLRGEELPYKKDPGVFRILVLGDSFVEGYTVNFEDTLTEVLKSTLQGSLMPRKVEVINAGIAGYSTDQEYLFMREIGVRYQPDLTIILFCYNDIYFNNRPMYERGSKPFFTLEGNQLVTHNVPVPTPTVESRGSSDRPSPGRFSSLLYTELRSRIWKRADKPSPPTPPAVIAPSNPWVITERLLKEISSLAGGRGHFAVSYIPRGTLIEPQVMASDKITRPEEAADPGRLSEICARNGIDFLDLTGALRAASKHEQMYFTRDPHWNRNGTRVAAQTIAHFLRERSLLQ